MPYARSSKNKITLPSKTYMAIKEFKITYCGSCSWLCCCRPDVIIMDENEQKVVGSVVMPCYPQCVCKMEVKCYLGQGRDDKDLLWTISKCVCNCHTIFGKNCGCCSDCAKYMDLDIVPGSAGNHSIHGQL